MSQSCTNIPLVGDRGRAISGLLQNQGLVGQPDHIEEICQGGLSNAQIFHVWLRRGDDVGDWALRIWPSGRELTRLRAVHQIQTSLPQHGVHLLPQPRANARGETIWNVTWQGQMCPAELCSWIPGTSLATCYREDGTLVCRAIDTVRELHEALGPILQNPTAEVLADPFRAAAFHQRTPIDCPALARRRAEWRRLAQRRYSGGFDDHQLADLAARTRACLERWGNRLEDWLRPELVSLAVVLGDLRAEHILCCGSRIIGIIDVETMTLDAAAADFARLLGSLIPDDWDAWSELLPEPARSLAWRIDRSGVLVSLARWQDWFATGARPAHDGPAVARWTHLLRRAETWR